MSYTYRTRTQQLKINIKTRIKKTRKAIKENLYHYNLIERPEVNWVNALPQPGETSA